MTEFEPKIVGFLCNWCSYAGADLAGVSRVQMAPNFRIIRIMCSGRIDPELCIRLLREGLDGVLVLGCHPGDCHYIDGNYFAEIKMEWTLNLLKKTEFGDGRLMLDWVSASEDQLFASIVSRFQDTVRGLGPNPINEPDNQAIRDELDAVLMTLTDFRLRTLMGKVRTIRNDGNVYGEAVRRSELDAIVADAVDSEYVRNTILVLARDRDWSVPMLSERLDRDPGQILRHVVRLRQRNALALTGIKGDDPYYKTIGGV
jgi:F420-non-reducing hydrogenase iron-sulfur subunit